MAARKSLVFLAFSRCFRAFFVQFEAGPCDEANYGLVGLVLVLQAFQLFGILEPKVSFDPPNGLFDLQKHYVFKGQEHYVLKGKCPILTRKVYKIERTPKDKLFRFHSCTGPPSMEHPELVMKFLLGHH